MNLSKKLAEKPQKYFAFKFHRFSVEFIGSSSVREDFNNADKIIAVDADFPILLVRAAIKKNTEDKKCEITLSAKGFSKEAEAEYSKNYILSHLKQQYFPTGKRTATELLMIVA